MRDQDVFLERALVEEGLLTDEKLEEARAHSRDHEVDIVDALVETEILTGKEIALTRANVCESPYIELSDYEPTYSNTQLFSRTVAERYCVFPLFMIDGVLTLAMDNPLNLEATDHVRQVVKCEVDAVLCDRESLRALISRSYSLSHSEIEQVESTDETEASEELLDSQPIVAAVNQMLADAAAQGASDVHINPDERALHLRYRIDGVLQQKQGPPRSMHSGIVQRLKVMSNLDLTQTRRPQDGKFRYRHEGITIDVRVSTVPTVCGENVVLRLLPGSQKVHDFGELGVPESIINEIQDILDQPYGMFLVTGPTGSGKTTTLYAAMSKINDPSLNLMTIEDPVEIRMPYVRQIQVHPQINLTFATALRSILRQDPDVVLVGEIRDGETATIALQAALTGHMVLSTAHTNDAVGAVARLRDFGLPSFVINSAVLGVLAQRLVRRVCSKCSAPDKIDDSTRRRFRLSDREIGFVLGKGCANCSQTGYRGRIGIYELLRFTSAVKSIVEEEGTVETIREQAVRSGMRLMWQDGVVKAQEGLTTLEEIATAASVIEIEDQLEHHKIAA